MFSTINKFSSINDNNIKDAFHGVITGQTTQLDLSDCELTVESLRILIKENRDTFKKITSINLAGNELTDLPEEIYEFDNLQSILLDSNKISTISDKISNLTQLTKIDLMGNNFTEIPESLKKLNLRTLYLQNNHIKSIPTDLLISTANPQQRTKIYLFGNPINNFSEITEYLKTNTTEDTILSDIKLNEDFNIIDNDLDPDSDFNIKHIDNITEYINFTEAVRRSNIYCDLLEMFEPEEAKRIRNKIKGSDFENFLTKINTTNHWKKITPEAQQKYQNILKFCLSNENAYSDALAIASAHAQDCTSTTTAGLIAMGELGQEINNKERLKFFQAKEIFNFYKHPAIKKMITDFISKKSSTLTTDPLEEYLNFSTKVSQYLNINLEPPSDYPSYNSISESNEAWEEFWKPLWDANKQVDRGKLNMMIAAYILNHKSHIIEKNQNISAILQPAKDVANRQIEKLEEEKRNMNTQEYIDKAKEITINKNKGMLLAFMTQVHNEARSSNSATLNSANKRFKTNDKPL